MKNLNRKGILRSAAILAVNLSILVVLVELTGLVAYFFDNGHLYYTHRSALPATLPAVKADVALREPLLLHPYVGYVFPPDLTVPVAAFNPGTRALYESDGPRPLTAIHINNFGFVSEYDYPYARRGTNELVIGVFGGSVAHFFALQGAEALRARLRASPAFRGQPVTILNFAQSGYKQPQQLLLLAFLLSVGQPFDAIVNIDGVNELALGAINQQTGLHASMPTAQHVLPLLAMLDKSSLAPREIDSLYRLRQLKTRLSRYDAYSVHTRSAALHLAGRLLCRRAEGQYRRELVRYGELAAQSADKPAVLYLWKQPRETLTANALAELFAVWGDASLAMQRLCHASGIPYLEVVQPNQYFTRKTFTPAERAAALNPQSPFKHPVELGYPGVGEFIQTMQHRGLNIVSGTSLFDDQPQPMYLDDCCHYRYAGYQLLAGFVTDHLAPLFVATSVGTN